MSKELSPLEWLNYYKRQLYASHRSFRDGGFDIIETALKRLEQYEEYENLEDNL